MPEYIDLIDDNNRVIGVTDTETAHKQRLLHRVVGVFLFDTKGNLYLQNENKYNKLDLSVGGHVKQGESYMAAARREMQEELGIEVSLSHIGTFLPANNKKGHFWALYQGQAPLEWCFSPTEEVTSIIAMHPDEISKKIQNSPELFTHGFVNTFTEFNRLTNKDLNVIDSSPDLQAA